MDIQGPNYFLKITIYLYICFAKVVIVMICIVFFSATLQGAVVLFNFL